MVSGGDPGVGEANTRIISRSFLTHADCSENSSVGKYNFQALNGTLDDVDVIVYTFSGSD
jgi:hypothetical protein